MNQTPHCLHQRVAWPCFILDRDNRIYKRFLFLTEKLYNYRISSTFFYSTRIYILWEDFYTNVISSAVTPTLNYIILLYPVSCVACSSRLILCKYICLHFQLIVLQPVLVPQCVQVHSSYMITFGYDPVFSIIFPISPFSQELLKNMVSSFSLVASYPTYNYRDTLSPLETPCPILISSRSLQIFFIFNFYFYDSSIHGCIIIIGHEATYTR